MFSLVSSKVLIRGWLGRVSCLFFGFVWILALLEPAQPSSESWVTLSFGFVWIILSVAVKVSQIAQIRLPKLNMLAVVFGVIFWFVTKDIPTTMPLSVAFVLSVDVLFVGWVVVDLFDLLYLQR